MQQASKLQQPWPLNSCLFSRCELCSVMYHSRDCILIYSLWQVSVCDLHGTSTHTKMQTCSHNTPHCLLSQVASHRLSNEPHYDFAMRTLKSVLLIAAQLRTTEHGEPHPCVFPLLQGLSNASPVYDHCKTHCVNQTPETTYRSFVFVLTTCSHTQVPPA